MTREAMAIEWKTIKSLVHITNKMSDANNVMKHISKGVLNVQTCPFKDNF